MTDRDFDNLQLNGELRRSSNKKGNLLVGDDTQYDFLQVGSDGRFLVADSGEPTGLNYARTPGEEGYIYARVQTGFALPSPNITTIIPWGNISQINNWTVSPTNRQFTCQIGGLYLISYGVELLLDVSSAAGGTLKCNINVNGVTPLDSDNEYSFPGNQTTINVYTNQIMALFNGGDTLDFRIVLLGGTVTFNVKNLRAATRMSVIRIR